MRKRIHLGIALFLVLSFSGCGGGDSRSVFVAQVFSDQPADGDIAFDPVLQTFTITNGPDFLFFGIDDLAPNLPEYRAFLDFPLDASTGGDAVPATAAIVSATLDLFISEVSFNTVVPTLVDLVTYPVTGLREQDYSNPPLAVRSLNLFATDEGNFVAIDVTPLMREAQRLGLPDFQVRLLLDPAAVSGFVGIEDLPSVTARAPLLTVEYE